MMVGTIDIKSFISRGLICLCLTGCVHQAGTDRSHGPFASSQTLSTSRSFFGLSLGSKHAGIVVDPSQWPDRPTEAQTRSRFNELFPNLTHRLENRRSVVLGKPQHLTAEPENETNEQVVAQQDVAQDHVNEDDNSNSVALSAMQPVQIEADSEPIAQSLKPIGEMETAGGAAKQPTTQDLTDSTEVAGSEATVSVEPTTSAPATTAVTAVNKPEIFVESPASQPAPKTSTASDPAKSTVDQITTQPQMPIQVAEKNQQPLTPSQAQPEQNQPVIQPSESLPIRTAEQPAPTLAEQAPAEPITQPVQKEPTIDIADVPAIPVKTSTQPETQSTRAVTVQQPLQSMPAKIAEQDQPANAIAADHSEVSPPQMKVAENSTSVKFVEESQPLSNLEVPAIQPKPVVISKSKIDSNQPPAITAEVVANQPPAVAAEEILNSKAMGELEIPTIPTTQPSPRSLPAESLDVPPIPVVAESNTLPPSSMNLTESAAKPIAEQPSDRIALRESKESQIPKTELPANVVNSPDNDDLQVPQPVNLEVPAIVPSWPEPLTSSEVQTVEGSSPLIKANTAAPVEIGDDIPPPVPAPEIDIPSIPETKSPMPMPTLEQEQSSSVTEQTISELNQSTTSLDVSTDTKIERSSAPAPESPIAHITTRDAIGNQSAETNSFFSTSKESQIPKDTETQNPQIENHVPELDQPVKMLEPLPDEPNETKLASLIQRTDQGNIVVRLHLPNPMRGWKRPMIANPFRRQSPESRDEQSGLQSLKSATVGLFRWDRQTPAQQTLLTQQHVNPVESPPITDVANNPAPTAATQATLSVPIVNQTVAEPAQRLMQQPAAAESQINPTPVPLTVSTSNGLPAIQFPASYHTGVRKSANPWAHHARPAVNPYVMNPGKSGDNIAQKQAPIAKSFSASEAERDTAIVPTSMTITHPNLIDSDKPNEISGKVVQPVSSKTRRSTQDPSFWTRAGKGFRSIWEGNEEIVPAKRQPWSPISAIQTPEKPQSEFGPKFMAKPGFNRLNPSF